MTDLSLWKLATDAGLVLALLYLCARFARSNRPVNTAKLIGLQRGLKSVLKEAERASEQLEAKLGDRQRELEQLLYDLQTVESRVNKVIDSAEHTRRSLQQPQMHEVPAPQQPQFQQPQHAAPVEHSYAQPAPQMAVTDPYGQAAQANTSFAVAEPASFDVRGAASEHLRQTARDDVPRNIFGEPIASAQPVSQPTAHQHPPVSNLASQIEREVAEPGMMAAPEAAVQSSIEDVYARAEELLKQGESLESVAAGMRLPLDEVRMLSQIVSTANSAAQSAVTPQSMGVPSAEGDDRLGVLGGSIRRTRQVL